MDILHSDPLAKSLTTAIQTGDVAALQQLLETNSQLATARLVDNKDVGRTLLHIATDWPGHFPRVARTVALLIEAGADPNAAVCGAARHPETPLHWAASSNDVAALDALLDGGADIEAPGAVFTNGTAMSDAVIFAQWNAARRLLERGAKTTLTQSAALGLMDRLTQYFDTDPAPPIDQITAALWHACRGGQQPVAEYLVAKGANINWLGWDKMTPLDCARRSGNRELVEWLQGHGAKSSGDRDNNGPA